MAYGNFRNKSVRTYKLVANNKTTYIGSSNDLSRRLEEHLQAGKKFDRIVPTSPALSRQEAERREARNLNSYREAMGQNPKYNKTFDGKFKKRP